MKRKFKFRLPTTLLFLTGILISSCSNNSSNYLGTWRNTKYKNQILIITQSDKNFLIETQNLGDVGDKTLSATYEKENEKLVINYEGRSFDVIIDNRNNLLFLNGMQFEKQ